MNRYLRKISLMVLVVALGVPVAAQANVRGTGLSWGRSKSQQRYKARVRVARVRRAKPSPFRLRRMQRSKLLAGKLRVRRFQDIPDSELANGEGRGVRSRMKRVKERRAEPVFGPE